MIYTEARNTLADLLEGWVFGEMVEDVKHPKTCENSSYFYGNVRLNTARHQRFANKTTQTLWMQSKRKATRPFVLAGVSIPVCTTKPCRGDAVMGRRTKTSDERTEFVQWYSHPLCSRVKYLKHIVLNGTTMNEMQLMSELSTQIDDRLWLLARIVLFGNLRCVFEQHVMIPNEPSAVAFVHTVTRALRDNSIWTNFKTQFPERVLLYEDNLKNEEQKHTIQPLCPPAEHPWRQIQTPKLTFPWTSTSVPSTWSEDTDANDVEIVKPFVPPWYNESEMSTTNNGMYTPMSPQHGSNSPPYTPMSPQHGSNSPPYIPSSPILTTTCPPSSPMYNNVTSSDIIYENADAYDPNKPTYNSSYQMTIQDLQSLLVAVNSVKNQ
jgi:hypothetical protein